MNACMCLCGHVLMQVRMCIDVHEHIIMCGCVCEYMCKHACTYMFMLMYIDTDIHGCVCVFVFAWFHV